MGLANDELEAIVNGFDNSEINAFMIEKRLKEILEKFDDALF